MSIFTSNAAAVNQGQSVITCTDNSDFSGVPSGSVVIINNDHLAVVDSGTAASSNNSTLTLRSPWPSDLPDITAGKLFVLAGVDAIKETVESSRLVTTALITTKQALQAIIDAQGTAATADLTTSATDNSGALRAEDAYSPSSINFHSGNLNNAKLGGEGVGRVVMQGYAASSSSATFLHPINRITPPSSISVFGSFTVHGTNGQSIDSNDYVPFLSSISSNSMLVLGVSGLSGLAIGDVLTLRAKTTSSRIVY